MEKPFFSLVMTVYNCAPYVEEALRSMLSQDYDGKMEFIVVDDASTDGSLDVIRRVAAESSQDVRIIPLTENVGVAGATEAGWSVAQGDWIIMVDGDDIQMPDRCAKTARILEHHSGLGMICMAAFLIDSQGKQYGQLGYGGQPYEDAQDELLLDTASARCSNMCAVGWDHRIAGFGCAMAISRQIVKRWGAMWVDGVSSERYAQDPTWELRAILSAPILGSREYACQYRSHANNLLNRTLQSTGQRWMREHELFMCRHLAFEAASYRQMLRDVQRAMTDNRLTDWSQQELSTLYGELSRQLASREMGANWWSLTWLERIYRAFRYRNQVSGNFRTWAWWRLLPLSVFCWLKSLKR